jgi:hydrocephalus-inducing protein
MTGHQSVTLINHEDKPFEFCFDQNSCYAEGRSAVMLVEPASGTVPAKGKIPIELTFKPQDQRQFAFNLKCAIGNQTKPLCLNVKTEGFTMQTALVCEDPNGLKVELTPDDMNVIHLGEIEKNEVTYRNLHVMNSGKHSVDFEWFLTSEYEDSAAYFTIEPSTGMIAAGEKTVSVLKFQAKKEKPAIVNLLLKIEHGSVYHIHVDGIAVRPNLQFSFTQYDFGPCFIYKAGMPIVSQKLAISNTGNFTTV